MEDSGGFERYRSLVPDWEPFVRACSRPLPTVVWANRLRTTPEALAGRLADEGLDPDAVDWYEGAFRISDAMNPGTTLSYLAGLYHIQEEVSLLPVHVLAPRPGERVLDLCAAPGGKTLQAAIALENRGTVVANDRSGIRLNVLRTALYRMGLTNVSTVVGDAARFSGPDEWFDCVIADVPCSCEGTSRKHASVVGRASRPQSAFLAEKQRAILKRAAALCRPGGRIVYATCTYAPEENELVVDALLRSDARLRIRAIDLSGLTSAPGVTEWEDALLSPQLALSRRIWPHQNDTGGFYVALLEKEA